MRIPTITGIIDRRILINYQADADTVSKILPAPFRPKLVQGKAIVGICLIRLKHIRPKGIPSAMGISSENGAHRIAVEWMEDGETREGVYIPRRDTSSKLNYYAGGRLFPGMHHLAHFDVQEGNGQYAVEFKSSDGAHLSVAAVESDDWSNTSVFDDVDCASAFFQNGSVGYSPVKSKKAFEGLELKTKNWKVSPLSVSRVTSSFFENKNLFPEGSITFDNALLMKNIEHEWHSKRAL